MTLSIIFVDDEPYILLGLRRMLRNMRKEWDMSFVESGKAALKLMKEKHFDIIISDMRMPETDGAQLLMEVKKKYPHMVRIILSGHSDKELVLKTVKTAHQFLAKPCDAEKIMSTIRDACILRDLFPEIRLRNFMTQIDSLPSLPATYLKLVEALEDPEISIKRVSRIITMDISMTVKLLKMVNSAFFGLGRHISDPVQAIQLLGLGVIRALVLTVEIFSKFDERGIEPRYLEQLLNHSMKVAALSKAIAQSEAAEDKTVDDAFLSGLLHDVGKLVLATYDRKKYSEVIEKVDLQQENYDSAEKQVFNATHCDAGAYLLCLWGIPGNIVKSVAFHHNPLMSPNANSLELIATSYASAFICQGKNPQIMPVNNIALTDCAEILGITDKLPYWEELARDLLQQEGYDE